MKCVNWTGNNVRLSCKVVHSVLKQSKFATNIGHTHEPDGLLYQSQTWRLLTPFTMQPEEVWEHARFRDLVSLLVPTREKDIKLHPWQKIHILIAECFHLIQKKIQPQRFSCIICHQIGIDLPILNNNRLYSWFLSVIHHYLLFNVRAVSNNLLGSD